MKLLFVLSCLVFAAVASQADTEGPLDEGIELVNLLLLETSKAITDHEAATPCAGLKSAATGLQTELDAKTTAAQSAVDALGVVTASISTKTSRQGACDTEIATCGQNIVTIEGAQTVLKTTFDTTSAQWQTRITDTEQVIAQIEAFQQQSVGGTKLSLLQSSLLQLSDQVSDASLKVVMDTARMAQKLGKQTSVSASASLSPSMIQESEVDAAALLKELFAKLQTELATHLTTLTEDKKTELDVIQGQRDTKQAELEKEKATEITLGSEKSELVSQLNALAGEKETLQTGVTNAEAASTTAQTDLDTNAAAITDCEAKYAADLKALQDENTSVKAIQTQLAAWNTGDAAVTDSGAMPGDLSAAIAAVSVKPCNGFEGCPAGQFQEGDCSGVTSTIKCTECKKTCGEGNYMQGTCAAQSKSDTIECPACKTCADDELVEQECTGITTSDTRTCVAHQPVKECKVINSKDLMVAAGWAIKGNNPGNGYYQCGNNFCNGVDRTKAYCGFQYPGVGIWEYTLEGSGTAHVTFGNSWGAATVNFYKNNVKLGSASAAQLNVQLEIAYVAGDVLKMDEIGDGVMVLQEFCLQ